MTGVEPAADLLVSSDLPFLLIIRKIWISYVLQIPFKISDVSLPPLLYEKNNLKNDQKTPKINKIFLAYQI